MFVNIAMAEHTGTVLELLLVLVLKNKKKLTSQECRSAHECSQKQSSHFWRRDDCNFAIVLSGESAGRKTWCSFFTSVVSKLRGGVESVRESPTDPRGTKFVMDRKPINFSYYGTSKIVQPHDMRRKT